MTRANPIPVPGCHGVRDHRAGHPEGAEGQEEEEGPRVQPREVGEAEPGFEPTTQPRQHVRQHQPAVRVCRVSEQLSPIKDQLC